MKFFRALCCAALALIALVPLAAVAKDSDVDTSFSASSSQPGWRRAYDNLDPTADQRVVAAARAPDGGYVLAGSRDDGLGGYLIFLAKFRPDGNYDNNFGGTAATGNAGFGRVLKDASFTSVNDMTIDAQGRIVVVGATPGALGQSDFGVVRFNSNGTDDTSFAGDGSAQIGFDLDSANNRTTDSPSSVTTAPDGSVYVAGLVMDVTAGGTATSRVGVAKFMADGSNANTGYGTLPSGRQIFCASTCEDVGHVARIVYDAPRNRMFIGGDYDLTSQDSDWFIITQVFGTSPSSTTTTYPINLGGDSEFQGATMASLAVQADGKPVALGFADHDENSVSVVLRRQANSSAEDVSFGNVSGRGIQMLADSTNTFYRDLAIDGSGRIVVAGGNPNHIYGYVTRLLPTNGAVDISFTSYEAGMIYRAKTSDGSETAYRTNFVRVFLDAGRPVLAGDAPDSHTADTDRDFVITRLKTDSIFANGFE